MANEISKNLKNLGFKASEVKVYVSLTKLGEASAAQIAKKADMPRTTVISILEKLKEKQFLTTHKYRGLTYYWIESPKSLVNNFEHKIEIANVLNNLLTEEYRKEAKFPFVQVFDTKTGIRQFIEKLLTNLDKNSTIYTIDQPKAGNYTKIFSEKAGDVLFKYKKRNSIKTKTLIPHRSFDKDVVEKTKKQDIEIRELPEKIDFQASLWIINDFLIHFSGNPPLITSIKHEKIVSSMKSVYDFLWSISSETKIKK